MVDDIYSVDRKVLVEYAKNLIKTGINQAEFDKAIGRSSVGDVDKKDIFKMRAGLAKGLGKITDIPKNLRTKVRPSYKSEKIKTEGSGKKKKKEDLVRKGGKKIWDYDPIGKVDEALKNKPNIKEKRKENG